MIDHEAAVAMVIASGDLRRDRGEHEYVAAKAVKALEMEKLIREVLSDHADCDSPWYNGCDIPRDRCAWCVAAIALI